MGTEANFTGVPNFIPASLYLYTGTLREIPLYRHFERNFFRLINIITARELNILRATAVPAGTAESAY